VHGSEPIGELLKVRRGDLDSLGRGDHFPDCTANVGKGDVDVGNRQGLQTGDELPEPEAHGARLAKQPLRDRCDGCEIEDRLVAVKDNVADHGHGGLRRD
jgi:hypothetical protein